MGIFFALVIFIPLSYGAIDITKVLPDITYWNWDKNGVYVGNKTGTAVVDFVQPNDTVLNSTEINAVDGNATPGMVYFDDEAGILYVADQNGNLNLAETGNIVDDIEKVTGTLKKESLYFDKKTEKVVLGKNISEISEPVSPAFFRIESELPVYIPGSVNVLLAYWDFDENNGNILNDSEGDFNGNINGATWTLGKNGSGLSFASEDYVEGSSGIVNGYPFSVVAWIKAEPVKRGSGERAIVSFANNNVNSSYYGMYLNKKGNVSAVVRNGRKIEAQSDFSVDDGQWHQVAAVFASDSDRSIYVDGKFAKRDTRSVSFNTSLNTWSIGRWGDLNPDSYFSGEIDEVKVFSKALSDTEISEQFLSS